MRHFLALTRTPPTLSLGMVQASAKARLIAPTGGTHALSPGIGGTRIGAISLPAIAPTADPLLALTPRAIEDSVAAVDDRTDSSLLKAGQLVPIASLSSSGQALSTIGADSPEGSRGRVLEPSPLPRHTYYRSCACPHNRARRRERSREKKSNQIYEEEDGSDFSRIPGEPFRLRLALFTTFARFLSAVHTSPSPFGFLHAPHRNSATVVVQASFAHTR